MKYFNRHITLLALAAAATFAATARQLTPDEALAAAAGPASRVMRAPAAQMRLAATYSHDGLNTIYAFDRDGSDAGFVLVAADDVSVPVLGYSDSGDFRADAMPANLSAWLESYSAQIAAAAASGQRVGVAALRGSRADVAPILTTRWNQDAPYNNQVPLLNDRRCVTGCVATAAAQVLNHYRWPDCGTGTASYKWETGKKTLTYDFSAHPFDWDNMLDTYPNGGNDATAAQRDAVATLMYACGMASAMEYDPVGSGTSDFELGQGLINHLKYDKSLWCIWRDYHPVDEWVDMIYGEISAGYPVLYCGSTQSGAGHAFVLDGYNSADGYFHVNWGWGGLSDGYFAITTLNPESQGIGGASDGFAYSQSALIGLRKAEAGSDYKPYFVLDAALKPTKMTVDRWSEYWVTFNESEEEALYNLSLTKISAKIGLKLTSTAGSQVRYMWMTSEPMGFDPLSGLNAIPFSAEAFPLSGTWRIDPVVQVGDKTYPVYVRASEPQYLTVTCTSSNLTFTQPTVDYALVCDQLDLAPAYTAGEDVSISALLRNTGNTDTGLITASLRFAFNNRWAMFAATENIGANSETPVTFTGKLSADVPDGDYPLQMVYTDINGNWLTVDLGVKMHIGAYDGINDAAADVAGTSAWPNPATDHVTVAAGAPIRSIALWSAAGAEVLTADGNGTCSATLNLGGIAPGIYIARIATDAGIETLRIIKKQ